MLKLHPLLAKAVVENLNAIFSDNKYADKVIAMSLKKNSKWGSRDRKFVAETTYEIVRNYRLFHAGAETKNPWPLLATFFVFNGVELPPWKEFSGLNVKRIKNNLEAAKNTFKLVQSVPDWLDDLGRGELGLNWEKEMSALNQEASVVLRVNTLKVSINELRKQLASAGIETDDVHGAPEALTLRKRQNVFVLPEFKKGLFEIQDVSSQLVTHFVKASEGHRVIDACAGGGGKSLHLAAIMKNKGKIISMDVRENKLDELRRRAVRAGVFNIEAKLITEDILHKLKESADRVLLDAPCSGLGVLRRNPDAKWKLSFEKINEIKIIQSKILSDYSSMVKPGGKLIYATCSILPSENSEQVKKFLLTNSNFTIEEEKSIFPSEGYDGFYMCRMHKSD